MRERRSRQPSLFALLLALVVLTASAPFSTQAQEPAPVTEPTPVAEPVEEPVAGPQLPEGYTPPPQLAGLSVEDLAALQFPEDITGPVSINVAASPQRFKAPIDLVYTFSYQNNSGSSASGIVVRVTFSKWVKTTNSSNTDPNKVWQFCADTNCNPENVQGPAVQRVRDITGGVEYSVGDLANGQAGSFQLRLRVPNNVYPVATTSEPRRPASSAQLFLNNNTGNLVSENTGTALAEGPVFLINKTRTGPNAKIYPLEIGEFLIKLQNLNREDSVTANNIVLTDILPENSTYVPGDGDLNPQQVTVNGKPALRWNITSPLPKNNAIEIRVRFRANDGPAPCPNLRNAGSGLTVTSDEIPLKPGSQTDRFTIASRDNPSYTLQPPAAVASIAADPASTPFGGQTALTIKVRNYWPQPIVNGRLTYNIQPNATYLAGSATGTGSGQVISEPNSQLPGGQIVWRLDMDPGTMTKPSEKTFSISLRAGFTTVGKGTAVVTMPDGIPGNCLKALQGQARIVERIEIGKYTDVEKIDNNLFARKGESFPYYIEVTNKGPDPVENLRIVDFMPDEDGANFRYNDDATLDDVPISATWTDGRDGRIEWEAFSVAPGQTRTIRYTTTVDGVEFKPYCNELGTSDIEDLAHEEVKVLARAVCIRINPDFDLEKILVNPADANIQGPLPVGGKEIKFLLRLTNNDEAPYELALYDALPPAFSFVRVESVKNINGQPILNEIGDVEWDLQQVPVGTTLEVVLVTQFDPPCAKQTYKNELMFKFKNNQSQVGLYYTVPRTTVPIVYTCGTNVLEYSQRADRDVASLADEVIYTLTVTNKNIQDPLRNVTVVELLPPGFEFVGMANSGAGAGAPQIDRSRADKRLKLIWTVPEIQANKKADIAFKARTSNVINQDYRAWMYATAPELLSAICRNPCQTVQDEGQDFTFAYDPLEVRPLHTYTPQILVDDSTVDECAEAGAIRTYRLTLINTNIHAYTSTVVTTTLPLGLHFIRPIGNTPHPQVLPQDNGSTKLVWSGLTVPKKPDGPLPAELELEVELEIGQVWGDQATLTEVTSPDGLIPLTDNVFDPTVKICLPDGPAIAKDSSMREVRSTSTSQAQVFFYQIEVVNPSAEALTLDIEDQLPAKVTFVERTAGPTPQVTDNTLRWSGLTVPAATEEGTPGVLKLLFKVRVSGASEGELIENIAQVLNASQEVDTSLASIGVEVRQLDLLYLPQLFQ